MNNTQVKSLVNITKQELVDHLTQLKESGKVFSVVFTKKDGTERKMVSRFGVTKHLAGGTATYNGKDNSLNNVGVYEMVQDIQGRFTEGQYRCFSLDRVKSIKVSGTIMEVK